MIPGLDSPLIGSGTLPSISYIGFTVNITNQQVYTFNSQSVGLAGNRKTILGILSQDSAPDFSVSSVLVNGIAATSVVQSTATGSEALAALYIIDNPTGTTANIVVTFSESVASAALIIWAAYDLSSETPTDTENGFETASAALTLSLNVAEFGVAAGVSCSTADPETNTWVGFTERLDSAANGEFSIGAADYTATTAQTPLTVTSDWTGANDAAGVSASFR